LNEINEKISVGEISSLHVSKPIIVEARISKIYPIKVKLIEGAFQCQRCDHITRIKQPITDKLIKPYECENDACGSKKPFKLIHEESTWIDEQKLVLQDIDEQLRTITVIIRGRDLIDAIPAEGSYATVTGNVRVVDNDSNLFDKVLEANHIEAHKTSTDTSKTRREKIKALREIIHKLQDEYKGAAPLQDIIKKSEESGFKAKEASDLIQSLKSAGEIIESSNERFRVV
jgi:DNA replicative helicase MCM subunit Mcm2 (Cdc46/Mcm family)